ncbi:MAG: hypothetical protein K2Q22_12690 [Cytophagales bacterium]|nr:hypothetical protein [Cytophagales bacterium]
MKCVIPLGLLVMDGSSFWMTFVPKIDPDNRHAMEDRHIELEKELPFKIIGSWSKQSVRLKKMFPQLTDTDLRFETDGEIQLLYRVQNKLHMKLDEVIALIKQGMPEKD